ncbi:MAG: polysaccharide biosynthesis tyrosine autokinase [Bryobacterales bacterium]
MQSGPPELPNRYYGPQPQQASGARYMAPPRIIEVMPDSFDGGGPGGPEQNTLLEYWQALYQNRFTLFLFLFLGGALGWMYTLPKTPIYRAVASLEVQEINESFLNMGDFDMKSRSYSEESKLLTEMKMLESKSLRTLVREKLANKEAAPGVLQRDQLTNLLALAGLPPLKPPPTRADAINHASGSVIVRNPRSTRIVEIVTESTDPRVAADFANTLAQTYIEETVAGRLESFRETTAWLNEQLEEIKRKLQKSEDELLQYAKSSGLSLSGEADARLRQLQADLAMAERQMFIDNSRYRVSNEKSPMALPEVRADGAVQTFEQQLAQRQTELAKLETTLAPGHPKVKELKAEIGYLESALETARHNAIESVQSEFSVAKLRNELVQEAYQQQEDLVLDQSEKLIYYNMLKREVETEQSIYRSMAQRVKEASVASAMTGSNTRIVDPAELASRPYSPNPSQSAMVGAATGLFCGVMFVFLRNSSETRLRGPGETAGLLGIPELGAIPSIAASNADGRRLIGGKRQKKKPLSLKGGDEKTALDPHLQSWSEPSSPMLVEAFRSALTSLLMKEQPGRALIFTSPEAGEGKSATVSHLALAVAEIGRSVVVVDADLRSPRQQEIFDVSMSWGLTDLVSGGTDIDSLPREGLAKETAIENVWVLPAGPAVANAARPFHSREFRALLERLKREFDMVLIDTPPVLSFTDARIMARYGDDVVLIFRAGQTSRDHAFAATNLLRQDGLSILGSIVNDVSPDAAVLGHYAYSQRALRQ